MHILTTCKSAFDYLAENKEITNDNVEDQKDTFYISINDTCEKEDLPYFENKENVKVLYFDDCLKDLIVVKVGTGKQISLTAFTKKQAQELFEFILKHKDKKVCIIHCKAGVSRSAAVGVFIQEYFNLDKQVFDKVNPYATPNKLVLSLLHEVSNEKETV